MRAARHFLAIVGVALFLPGAWQTSWAAESPEKEASAGDAQQDRKDQGEAAELDELLKEFDEDQTASKHPDYDDSRYDFLRLGTDRIYMKSERFRLRDQILTFIPPLYQPAFVGHAYVLPPNAWRIAFGSTSFDIGSDDFLKDGQADPTHESHRVSRERLDLDVFYGLDHDFTIRVNIPYWSSSSRGSIHPAGVRNMDLFAEGNSSEIGDLSIFLKKKFWDQGNIGFNLAGVVGVKLPTGADDETFDSPLVLRDPMGNQTVAFGGGNFTRFSDDGRLPSALQPGTGAFGYSVGLFGTRQFVLLRSALHAGVLARFLDGTDGIDPGDELRFFASFVKPVYKDYLSVELAFNGMHKEEDHYSGQFTHPVPDPVTGDMAGFATTDRPPFRGGTVLFASPSLIFIPNPWLRLTLSGMFRVNDPDLGPWPGSQLRVGTTVTF